MKSEVLKSKIHNAKVTKSNLKYTGSIEICRTLMDAAYIGEYEKVLVVNLENGKRYETYANRCKVGEICVNGAGALYSSVGDKLIIMSFGIINSHQDAKPMIVVVDDENMIENITCRRCSKRFVPSPYREFSGLCDDCALCCDND